MKVLGTKYNSVRDVAEVCPTGALDLRSAYLNNCVPSDLSVVDTEYNGIDDPSDILGRPLDQFDAMAMQKSINDYVKSKEKGADQ